MAKRQTRRGNTWADDQQKRRAAGPTVIHRETHFHFGGGRSRAGRGGRRVASVWDAVAKIGVARVQAGSRERSAAFRAASKPPKPLILGGGSAGRGSADDAWARRGAAEEPPEHDPWNNSDPDTANNPDVDDEEVAWDDDDIDCIGWSD